MAFAKLGDADKAWELFTLINPIHHSSTPARLRSTRSSPMSLLRTSTLSLLTQAAAAGRGTRDRPAGCTG